MINEEKNEVDGAELGPEIPESEKPVDEPGVDAPVEEEENEFELVKNDPEANGPAEDVYELSFGEKLVGIGFNPSGDVRVAKIKSLCAEIINELTAINEPSDITKKIINDAITGVLTAQMWAVKAITFKD